MQFHRRLFATGFATLAFATSACGGQIVGKAREQPAEPSVQTAPAVTLADPQAAEPELSPIPAADKPDAAGATPDSPGAPPFITPGLADINWAGFIPTVRKDAASYLILEARELTDTPVRAVLVGYWEVHGANGVSKSARSDAAATANAAQFTLAARIPGTAYESDSKAAYAWFDANGNGRCDDEIFALEARQTGEIPHAATPMVPLKPSAATCAIFNEARAVQPFRFIVDFDTHSYHWIWTEPELKAVDLQTGAVVSGATRQQSVAGLLPGHSYQLSYETPYRGGISTLKVDNVQGDIRIFAGSGVYPVTPDYKPPRATYARLWQSTF